MDLSPVTYAFSYKKASQISVEFFCMEIFISNGF